MLTPPLSLQHSCRPNLFLQNVFTDSHDPAFPVIAFFTSRSGSRGRQLFLFFSSSQTGFIYFLLCISVVKAGTELTWDYSSDVEQNQDVPCLCSARVCKGHFATKTKLCEAEEEA